MIYRVIAESTYRAWPEPGAEPVEVPGPLCGAFMAAVDGWHDLPMPTHLQHPRARFWFTEAGWRRYGRQVAAAAGASGRTYRVLRRKNPPASAVVYRDRWQVAVLPHREPG